MLSFLTVGLPFLAPPRWQLLVAGLLDTVPVVGLWVSYGCYKQIRTQPTRFKSLLYAKGAMAFNILALVAAVVVLWALKH